MSNSITEAAQRRVLVVDDDRHVRFMLCDLLAHLGCHAEGVPDPVEGLERLEQGAYDVLVTDFRMPRMTGVELVERARERNGALRVIMLTASSTDLDTTARRLGFTLLRKPVDLGRLTGVLDDATPVPRQR
jgi:CheY-like chemotaxis protein